jgi:hypothetical protein
MKHGDFRIGGEFRCGGRQWRCTDIGTRTIIAILLDEVKVGSDRPEGRRTLDRAKAEAEGWFNGPPYAVGESVFDEYDQKGCSLAAGDRAAEADAGNGT